jgi:hypothetical protein
MHAIALPGAATGRANGPKRPRRSLGAGWFEQGKPGERGRRLLLAERRWSRDEISRCHYGCHMLLGDVRKTMAAVARQLLLRRIRGGAQIQVQRHGSCIDPSETEIAPGAMDQRNQQTNSQQQDERQLAKPASGCCC